MPTHVLGMLLAYLNVFIDHLGDFLLTCVLLCKRYSKLIVYIIMGKRFLICSFFSFKLTFGTMYDYS